MLVAYNFFKLCETTLYCLCSKKLLTGAKIIPLRTKAINIQTINAEWLNANKLSLDVLRLDKIHEVVSGNKWFKLKYYLQEAKHLGKDTIATFGGAWSNHIVATAYSTKQAGLQSVGIIRGEKPRQLSVTLQNASAYGMELIYVSREEYRNKELLINRFENENWYWVNEGGYGKLGMQGASDILKVADTSAYTHIVAAVGTGTMLAGLVNSSAANQEVIGISSMKGNVGLEDEVRRLLINSDIKDFKIFHDYHFGGYGKHPQELIDFINNVYNQYQLPLDIIYTGKTFYAITQLARESFFKADSKILMIHSGGLQGNKSLPAKVLAF
jgi:1-aminocyclopropane-1-carboxylate deaminase